MIIEKRDADEAEQEQRAKLLRSRKGKDDDPDRDKKKKEAKMKQQQLQDEQQLKQADETALEASRRRPRNVAVSFWIIWQQGREHDQITINRQKITKFLVLIDYREHL